MAGMYAQVEVIAADRSNVVLVPREAVLRQANGDTVFVVADGKARARQVEIGLADEKSYQVVSGVAVGEPVVVVGQNVLRDGQEVRVPPSQSPGERQRSTDRP